MPTSLRTLSLLGIIATGLFAVVVGAEWLVEGATTLAQQFGVPEEVIRLTVVALGTSLPELATSVVAAYRGHSDVCVGNVVGSNIFNLFGITGVTALFAPLPFSDKIVGFDLPSLAVATLIILPFMLTGLKINRMEGSVLVALYCAYVGAQIFGMAGLDVWPRQALETPTLLSHVYSMTEARAPHAPLAFFPRQRTHFSREGTPLVPL